MTDHPTYTERMSRILADAMPATPRVGCVLLRCRLGARGRDLPQRAGAPVVTALEHRELGNALTLIAGPTLPAAEVPAGESDDPALFLVEPTEAIDRYGGPEAWAKAVRAYLNARGYGASVAVASSREQATAAARSRWGVVVVHDGVRDEVRGHGRLGRAASAVERAAEHGSAVEAGQVVPPAREITSVGIRAVTAHAPARPAFVAAPRETTAVGLRAPMLSAEPSRPGDARNGPSQLVLPGLRLGKAKRSARG